MMRSRTCLVEMLDRRVLLAAGWPPPPLEPTFSVADGILTVVGTDFKELVHLRTDAVNQQILVDLYYGGVVSVPLQDVQQVRIWTYDGNDLIDCGGLDLPVTIYAGAADDTIIGTMGADVIHGGAGRDFIRAVGGNDTVYGGAADDRIYLGSGDDVCHGRDGIDSIHGQLGSDAIWGEEGNDLINGQRGSSRDEDFGADTLWGGPGNDSLWLGKGASIAYGEDGDDLLAVVFLGEPVALTTLMGGEGNDSFSIGGSASTHADGGPGHDYCNAGEGDLLRDIETVEIPPGSNLNGYPLTSAIRFSGDLLYVYGSDKDDQISIASEDQRLLILFNGVQVDNSIAGLSGASIWGGNGNDTLDFSGLALPVTVIGGAGDDTILGSSAADELRGGAGQDSINGLAGNDALYGGDDDDTLIGDVGDDTLLGRAGTDLIDGGEGEDTREEDDLDTAIDVEIAILRDPITVE